MSKDRPQLVTFKLPRVLAGRLRAVARKSGKSQAEVIREGLQIRLDDHQKGSPGSVLDLIDDLVGTLAGSADLGSHPRHMRGFGK